MSDLVIISLLGWTPVVLLLFLAMPPRRAVIVAFIAAWLFLPVNVPDSLYVEGLPELNKMTVTCLAVLLGALMFDRVRLLSFRPRRIDLPMAVWCVVPLFSSLTNQDATVWGHPPIPNPVYDGLSEVLKQTVTWGLPYLIGRVYFTHLAALRELAVGIVIGGLVYVPLCVFELKMSPQLHYLVYGQHPHSDFSQTVRGGGWRPTVFMAHGLMVALWMASASIVGAWLWFTKSIRSLFGLPIELLLAPLVIVAVLCKSTAAVGLLFMGLGVLYLATRLRARWIVVALILAAPAYMTLRTTQLWEGTNVVALAQAVFGEDRAQSLETRMVNENLLSARALEKPLFGWAGWGRSRVFDRHGKDISITDGQWVIALGRNGLVGLAAFTTALLLPVWLTLRRFPIRYWSHPKVAPAAAMAVVLIVYMIDNLLNAMINPVFMLVAGALAGQQALRRRRRVQRPGTRHAANHSTETRGPAHAAAMNAG